MTKHNIYLGVNCTYSDQPKPPSNSSISLYTSIIGVSGHIIPKNGIQASAFTPQRMKILNLSWCLVCKCIITLKLWPTKTKLNPTSLTQATFLNGQHGKQAFPVAVLPQRVTPSSACLKGVPVISNSFLPHFFSFHYFFQYKLMPRLKGIHPVALQFVFVFFFRFGKGGCQHI